MPRILDNIEECLLPALRETLGVCHDTLTVQCRMPKASKLIIDELDALLAKHYGLTDEELDFIINYDIKYRTGGGNGDEEME